MPPKKVKTHTTSTNTASTSTTLTHTASTSDRNHGNVSGEPVFLVLHQDDFTDFLTTEELMPADQALVLNDGSVVAKRSADAIAVSLRNNVQLMSQIDDVPYDGKSIKVPLVSKVLRAKRDLATFVAENAGVLGIAAQNEKVSRLEQEKKELLEQLQSEQALRQSEQSARLQETKEHAEILSAMQSSLSASEARIADIQRQQQVLEAHAQTLLSASEARIADIQRQLQASEAHAQTLSQNYQSALQENEKLTSELADARRAQSASDSDLDKEREMNAALSAALKDATQRLNNVTERHERTKRGLGESQAAAKRYRKERNDAKTLYSQLEIKLMATERQQEEITRLNEEAVKLRVILANCTESLIQKDNEITAMQQQLQETTEAAKRSLIQNDNEIKALRQQFQETTDAATRNKSEHGILAQRYEKLKKEYEKLKKRYEAVSQPTTHEPKSPEFFKSS